MSKKQCRSLAEVRAQIDRLDNQLLRILSERKDFVLQAGAFKKDRSEVAAPERVRSMRMQRYLKAREMGLDPFFARDLFNLITGYFIRKEKAEWEKVHGELKAGDIPIREIRDGDRAELYQLQLDAYLGEGLNVGSLDIPPLMENLQQFTDELSGCIVLVAEYRATAIGMVKVRISGDTAEIGRLIVHPLYQGIGLGGRLLGAAEQAAGGVKRYELFTGKKSSGNIAFYRKRGYLLFEKPGASDLLVYMEKKNQAGIDL